MGTELVSTHGIDYSYQMSTIAHDTAVIRKHQFEMLNLQTLAAATALAQLDVSMTQLGVSAHIAQNTAIMARGIDRLNTGLAQLQNTATEQLSELQDVRNILDDRLTAIVQQQQKQQQTLNEIAATLRTPYETSVRELREAADKWLTSGNLPNRPARDREEDWADAMRLLRITTENPIGRQDYMAWFQIGYLLWKKDGNLTEAEDSFYRAQRLSSTSHDAAHIQALCHLAHMQHLQGKHTDAYTTIERVLAISDDHEIYFDAARYAACIDRLQDCAQHLERCIDLQPITCYTMFGEPDFKRPSVLVMLADVAERKLTEVRTRTSDEIAQHYQRILTEIHQTFLQVRCRVPFPANSYASVVQLQQELMSADLLQAINIGQTARAMTPVLLEAAILCLGQEVDSRVQAISQLRTTYGVTSRNRKTALSTAAESVNTPPLQPASAPTGFAARMNAFINQAMGGGPAATQHTTPATASTSAATRQPDPRRHVLEAELKALWTEIMQAEDEVDIVRQALAHFEAQRASLQGP